ncbi:amidohydrolase family protein [Lentisphaerota bacterium ZTH]|nr:amidohydrolase family protein [Lentisphaerota bacterium]WET05922.1 amidohydrolase family protein [Lentisphaerota bacterium ZTH]
MKKNLLNAALLLALFFPLASFSAEKYEFNDSHIHLTNYIQTGPSLKYFLNRMNKNGVKRSAICGLPLQLEWNVDMDGDKQPSYYLDTNAKLYYYSAVDSIIAREYLALPRKDQKRFDPMICGFNPADANSVNHIKQIISMYPGVFSGIGEFSIYKENVSGKIAGNSATLSSPALGRLFKLAAEIGLVVTIHCDIDSPNEGKTAQRMPRYFTAMYKLLKKYPDTTVIWAHTGLGRNVYPTSHHFECLKMILDNCPNVMFDISWDEVAEKVTRDEQTINKWAQLLKDYPDRFLFGTDSVAPSSNKYSREIHMYDKLWNVLPKNVQVQVKFQNYERVFNQANLRVRAWEQKHLANLSPKINWPHQNDDSSLKKQVYSEKIKFAKPDSSENKVSL